MIAPRPSNEQFLTIPTPHVHWRQYRDLKRRIKEAAKWMPDVVFRETQEELKLSLSISKDALRHARYPLHIIDSTGDFVRNELSIYLERNPC